MNNNITFFLIPIQQAWSYMISSKPVEKIKYHYNA